jgi:hypothetical protein
VVGGRSEGITVERVAGGHWRPGVGAGRRSGGAKGGVDEAGGGPVQAGITGAHGVGGAASVAPFGASTSTTMKLAWGWKVEEAPVAKLLRRSRRSGMARSTLADLARAESRGTRRARRG